MENDTEYIKDDFEDKKLNILIRGIKIMNPNFEPFNDFDSPVSKNKESEVQDIIDFDETGSQMTGNSKET